MEQHFYEAFLQKDQSVIKEFYLKEWKSVKAFIFKQGGSEEQAKDIMQISMSALYQNIRTHRFTLQPDAGMRTYFLQICKNQWRNSQKSVHHQRTNSINDIDSSTFADESTDVLEQLSSMDRQSIVNKFINMLGTKCKAILKAFYWDNDSLKDIAADNKIAESSAKTIKYRCLKKLKESMIHINVNEI